MERFIISGGLPLNGTVTVPGAKNAALPILAASIMLDGRTVIKNCPQLLDVKTSLEIIRYLGGFITKTSDNVSIQYRKNDTYILPENLCKKMRSSVLYLAPILYRCGTVSIYMPGGCSIGARPIDIHLDGLISMGASVEYKEDQVCITRPKQGLKGTVYKLKLPSVGATQTLIMAAATANGITVLHGCAKEPEISDLINFLNSAGADISGDGTGELVIKGVPALNGVVHTIIPDRIFAATVLAAVSACGGKVTIKNYPHEYMQAFEDAVVQGGLKIQRMFGSVYTRKTENVKADIYAQTGYYPEFATDMGPLLSAALCNNEGVLRLKETIFENRFSYLEDFELMGINCSLSDSVYLQTKGDYTYSGKITAKDLRAGAALTVAALSQRGNYILEGLEHIDRGYEKLEEVFASLGGNIRREVDEENNVEK